jgi:hypothetical protein
MGLETPLTNLLDRGLNGLRNGRYRVRKFREEGVDTSKMVTRYQRSRVPRLDS